MPERMLMGYASCVLWFKTLSMSTFNAGAKLALWRGFFAYFFAEYGERIGIEAQWQALDASLL